jgi:hypothetical protein
MSCTESPTIFEGIPDSKGRLDSVAASRRGIELDLLNIF